jgi:hypothetical protein
MVETDAWSVGVSAVAARECVRFLETATKDLNLDFKGIAGWLKVEGDRLHMISTGTFAFGRMSIPATDDSAEFNWQPIAGRGVTQILHQAPKTESIEEVFRFDRRGDWVVVGTKKWKVPTGDAEYLQHPDRPNVRTYDEWLNHYLGLSDELAQASPAGEVPLEAGKLRALVPIDGLLRGTGLHVNLSRRDIRYGPYVLVTLDAMPLFEGSLSWRVPRSQPSDEADGKEYLRELLSAAFE